MGSPLESSVAEAPKSGAGLAIILAIVGLVVLAAGVVIFVLIRQSSVAESLPPAATTEPAQPVVTAPPPPPAPTAPPPPTETQAAPPAPAPTETAATATPDAGTAQADQVELTVLCVPDCDSVKIDDKALELNDAGIVPSEPMQLAVGPHTIVAGRATYLAQTKKITLKAGQPDKETFHLFKPGPAPQRPCGKFLERCPGRD
jgi:hypothetical protein